MSAIVSLREVTRENLSDILNMSVAESQKGLVATNAKSIAEAHFAEDAWFRAIYADETPVGFVMLSDVPDRAEYYLWRMMVDAAHQRKGYGRRAVELLVEHVRTRPGAKELFTSHVRTEGNAGKFYHKLGFAYTGEEHDNELIMKLELEQSTGR